MKKMFKEFGAFIQRGNVLDLAVGLIIGNAFNAIVKSLVNDVIMPIIGLAGGKNFAEAKWVLVPGVVSDTGVVEKAEVAIFYGAFVQTVIDFLIIALTIFVIVKVITTLRERTEKRLLDLKAKLHKEESDKAKQEEIEKASIETVEEVVKEVKPTTDDILLEIRDLLKQKNE